jgi:hypothetical protein
MAPSRSRSGPISAPRDRHAASTPTLAGQRSALDAVPPPHPITRLEEVARGLELLAAELEDISGEPTVNLRHWVLEIRVAIDDLKGDARRTAQDPV